MLDITTCNPCQYSAASACGVSNTASGLLCCSAPIAPVAPIHYDVPGGIRKALANAVPLSFLGFGSTLKLHSSFDLPHVNNRNLTMSRFMIRQRCIDTFCSEYHSFRILKRIVADSLYAVWGINPKQILTVRESFLADDRHMFRYPNLSHQRRTQECFWFNRSQCTGQPNTPACMNDLQIRIWFSAYGTGTAVEHSVCFLLRALGNDSEHMSGTTSLDLAGSSFSFNCRCSDNGCASLQSLCNTGHVIHRNNCRITAGKAYVRSRKTHTNYTIKLRFSKEAITQSGHESCRCFV